MRSKFNAKHLADLVEEESKLDKRRRELATELNEMQASDTAWDEPRTATYQRLQMEHAQVGRDHTSVRQDRISYEGFAPKNAAKGSDSLVARFLLNGVNGLEATEQKIYCEGVDGRLVGLGGMDGIRIPIGPRAVTTGDAAASAADLVQEEIPPRVVERLAYYSGMYQAAQRFNTATGGDWPIPQMDAASEMGEILGAQATAVAVDDLGDFGPQSFSSKTFSSKSIELSRELLQDAVFDVQAYAERRAMRRIGRIANLAFTVTQTGAGLPVGASSSATAGITAASATAITWAESLALAYKVNRAYRLGGEMGYGGVMGEMGGMIGYMVSDDCERALRALVDGDGRPLWVASVREGTPDRYNGWPVIVNDDLDELATGKVPMLFGNFSYYGIRTVQAMEMFRFQDSRTMQKNAVECLAFMRMDGRPMGAIVSNLCEAYQKLTMA